MSTSKVDRNNMDANNDGSVSRAEWERYWKSDSQRWNIQKQRSSFDGIYSPKKGADFSKAGDQVSPSDLNLSTIEGQMKVIEQQLKQEGISKIKVEELENQMKSLKEQAELMNQVADKKATLTPRTGATPTTSGKFKAMSIGGLVDENEPLPQGSNPASAQSKALGLNTSETKAFTAPDGWGKASFGDLDTPDASTLYGSSIAKEQFLAQSWDEINKNTKKGKQLMLLFFYYAKLAESGDMGAIYQFMKFITYIISKDKAKQQIEMGKRLIQLQELSRQWTNKLLDIQTNSMDESASSELMKMMTVVKSETDAIATSQKLISQMMEEFAQVVETLTNTTKGALETYGRILRTVSTIR